MEPEVARMYSSSPPPLDDGAEDDDDEFGDFGGFSGVPSSVSFTDFDTPAGFGQSQSVADTSPPSLFNNGGATFTDLGPGPFGRGSLEDDSVSSDTDVLGADSSSSWDGSLPGKSAAAEDWKISAGQSQPSPSRTADETRGCNGGGLVTEVLTNGFTTFDMEEAPSVSSNVHPHKKGTLTDGRLEHRSSSLTDEFADFSAFSSTVTSVDLSQMTDRGEHRDGSDDGTLLGDRAESPPEGLSNGERVSHAEDDFDQRDMEPGIGHQCSKDSPVENGSDQTGPGEADMSKGRMSCFPSEDRSVGQDGEEFHGNNSLEDSGDSGRTGFDSSPPPCSEQTPPDFGKLPEGDDDEDFGDFGDATTCGRQSFADFDRVGDSDPALAEEPDGDSGQCPDEEDFGEFNSPKPHAVIKDGDGDEEQFADFPASDSFADFSSAPVSGDTNFDTGWNAFRSQEQGQDQGGDDSWAAFGPEQGTVHTGECEGQWKDSVSVSAPPSGSPQTSRRGSLVSLASRLERLFLAGFPDAPTMEPEAVEEVVPLQALLEPPDRQQDRSATMSQGGPWDVWQQLQDIHNAFGLRHQWGGSHSNKALLCSLGIDTRNILFTGQKKQPVIVPMYAASLGMLEPTKEPVKPISAAEKIASIAQAPPVSPEMSTCPPDPAQEALPPVQFDWSSSGLTNPLDASGGSSLLNLDFFGPVEDSSSVSTTSIPGVDPELYELTTAKLDTSSSSSRVADAFARLMSTVEKTSTSTRKPRKEENLSEEAAKVIASLPDLSFMQAKVLMFPATLTPLSSSNTAASN